MTTGKRQQTKTIMPCAENKKRRHEHAKRFMTAEVPTAFRRRCAAASRRRIKTSSFFFVFGLEFVFADAAFRAFPVVGQLFKRRSGRNVVFGIALFRIVHIAADFANVLLHDGHPLVLQWVAISFRDSYSFEQMISPPII